MKGAPVLLFVEDTPADCDLAVAILERRWPGLEWERIVDATGFRRALARPPDLIIADFDVPGFGALAALRILSETGSRIPLLVYSGALAPSQLDQCISLGAAGCLLKSRWSDLGAVVNDLLHPQRMASK